MNRRVNVAEGRVQDIRGGDGMFAWNFMRDEQHPPRSDPSHGYMKFNAFSLPLSRCTTLWQ